MLLAEAARKQQQRQQQGMFADETVEELTERAEQGLGRSDQGSLRAYLHRLLLRARVEEVLAGALENQTMPDVSELIGVEVFEACEGELERRAEVVNAGQRALHQLLCDLANECLAEIVRERRAPEPWVKQVCVRSVDLRSYRYLSCICIYLSI